MITSAQVRAVHKMTKHQMIQWLNGHGHHELLHGWYAHSRDELETEVLNYMATDDHAGAMSERRERCPVCGGFDPGDITHTRCAQVTS